MSSDTPIIVLSASAPPLPFDLKYAAIAVFVVLTGLFYLVFRTETFKNWSVAVSNWRTSLFSSKKNDGDDDALETDDELDNDS